MAQPFEKANPLVGDLHPFICSAPINTTNSLAIEAKGSLLY